MERLQGPHRQAADAEENRRPAFDLRGLQRQRRQIADGQRRFGELRLVAGRTAGGRTGRGNRIPRDDFGFARAAKQGCFRLLAAPCTHGRADRTVRGRGLGAASRRASIMSRQLEKRCSGSLAKARAIVGSSEAGKRSSRGRPCRCWAANWAVVRPS